MRVAAHAGQGLKHVFAKFILLDNFEPRNANALMKNLVRAAAQNSACVRCVGAGCGPGDQIASKKNRFYDHHVVSV